MPPSPVEPPDRRVRLGTKHTLVAGGLSSLLVGNDRVRLLDTFDKVSRVAGTVLYAASRLLLLYAHEKLLLEGLPFPPTGLTSESSFGHKDNMKWQAARDAPSSPAEAPVVFTQELVEWAMQLFKAGRKTQKRTKDNAAYKDLERLVEDNDLVADLGGLQDTKHMGSVLHALGKSLAVVISNHLTVATPAHTKLYLQAKYAHLYLSSKEATQLAKTIGRSVQWNNRRTELNGGVPYDTLPAHREQKEVKRHGKTVTIPEMDLMEWRAIVDDERALLPATWTQVDMLRGRFRMLRDILSRNTPERQFKAFTLIPQCRSGRVFLKVNMESLLDIIRRAGVDFAEEKPQAVPPDPARSEDDTKQEQEKAKKAAQRVTALRALAIFDQSRLQRLLRHPHRCSEKTVELVLGGEFFRTDGVQAQFYCGTLARPKRGRDGESKGDVDDDDGDVAASPEDGAGVVDDDDNDVVSPQAAVPASLDDLIAVDPGRTTLYTAVKARRVGEAERQLKYPDLAPLGDGTYVVWEKVKLPAKRCGKYNTEYLTKGAKQYDDECGGRLRRLKRAWRVRSVETYQQSLQRLSEASLACCDLVELKARIKVHMQCHAAIHLVEGSRDVARDRFDAYIRKQRELASIASDFRSVLGEKGVCAWGGARWAVGAKGSAPCRSAMVYKYLKRQSFGNRIFTEAETNTSRKNAISLNMKEMVHPHHPRGCMVRTCFQTTWADDGATVVSKKNLGKHRVGVFGGVKPHGLYLEQEGMKRTCSRDTNGASNIWRCYWERCHGRERPKTLQSSKKKNQGDASGTGRSA